MDRVCLRVSMLFCPTCSNMLFVEQSVADDGFRFYCRTCPYICNITSKVSITMKLQRKQVDDILGGDAAWANVDQTDAQCPKCTFGRAFFMMMQIRSADEPMTIFFKCANPDCGARWKQD